MIGLVAMIGLAVLRADTFASGGVTLSYSRAGQGQPMLCLAGGPGLDASYMSDLTSRLAKRNEVVVLDQRGTGGSQLTSRDAKDYAIDLQVDDCENLRRSLGFKSWIVLGHSWGAMLALRYAARYPSSISTLILLDSGPINGRFADQAGKAFTARVTDEDARERAKWTSPEEKAKDRAGAASKALLAVYPAYFHSRQLALRIKSQVKGNFVNPGISGLTMQSLGNDFDLLKGWPAKGPKTLIMVGDDDFIGVPNSEAIHAAIPFSELKVFKSCGHFPWIEAPTEMFESLCSLLAKD